MIWTDIMVERNLSDKEIGKTIGDILKIPLDSIRIVTDYEEFPAVGSKLIVCQKKLFMKGFKLLLSIYLFNEEFIKTLDEGAFTAEFSKNTKSRCLLSTDSHNPYQMYLYDIGNAQKLVNLDVDRLDNDGEYSIEGE